MNDHYLFAYGSLMCMDIMHAVAGDCGCLGRAVLVGYRCLCVKNTSYPGIIKIADHHTQGMLYGGISPIGWQRLDDFEGTMYQRCLLDVQLVNGQQQPAFVYVIKPEFATSLNNQDWNFEQFVQHGKAQFMDSYCGFEHIA